MRAYIFHFIYIYFISYLYRLGLGVIDQAKSYRLIVTDFLRFGGLELLDSATKVHLDDDYLRIQIPLLRRNILSMIIYTKLSITHIALYYDAMFLYID